jgi:hypothetical protein
MLKKNKSKNNNEIFKTPDPPPSKALAASTQLQGISSALNKKDSLALQRRLKT